MSQYTVPGSRILPLHNYNDAHTTPHASIQSITMGLRVGDKQYAIGYVHKFSFSMERDAKTIYQIEPYPGVLGDSGTASGITSSFSSIEFDEKLKYFPGEPIEVIPGKMGPITITLSRYALYTANLLAAVSRASASGVYDSTASPPAVSPLTANPINYVNILQQVRPFDIYQIFVSPITGNVLWGRKFSGCWFKKIGEQTPESNENAPILEEGEVACTSIRPLTESLGS